MKNIKISSFSIIVNKIWEICWCSLLKFSEPLGRIMSQIGKIRREKILLLTNSMKLTKDWRWIWPKLKNFWARLSNRKISFMKIIINWCSWRENILNFWKNWEWNMRKMISCMHRFRSSSSDFINYIKYNCNNILYKYIYLEDFVSLFLSKIWFNILNTIEIIF
jgi:hypothetical protein